MEYSDQSEYAVCNLASIALNKFVSDSNLDSKIHLYIKQNVVIVKRLKNY